MSGETVILDEMATSLNRPGDIGLGPWVGYHRRGARESNATADKKVRCHIYIGRIKHPREHWTGLVVGGGGRKPLELAS